MFINPVAVWVFLFRRYIQILCWQTDCTCESPTLRCDCQRLFLMFRISVISKVVYRDSQKLKKFDIQWAELLLPDPA